MLPRSRGDSGLEEILKEQVILACNFNITFTETDAMTLPVFDSVRKVAKQLGETPGASGQPPLSPGVAGRARIY